MAIEKTQRLDQFAGAKYMLPNLLVNPGFEIWQRGAGPFTSTPEFGPDEWRVSGSGMSVTRDSSPKFGTYCAKCDWGSGGGFTIQQGIECYKSLEGLYLTVCVWVKTTNSGVYLRVGDFTTGTEWSDSAFHTGGGAWEQLIVTKLIRSGLAGTAGWPHSFGVSVQVNGPTEAGTDTLYTDGAVAVAAEVAFPEGLSYAPLNPAEDMARCERFYEIEGTGGGNGTFFSGYISSGSTYYATVGFHTRKYATPTMTFIHAAASGFPAVADTLNAATIHGFSSQRTANATQGSGYFASNWLAAVT